MAKPTDALGVEQPMIDFSRAFGTAWERMCVILFRPFDLTKWCLIGFNAFLAVLAEGGASFNNPFPMGNSNQSFGYTGGDVHVMPILLNALKHWLVWVKSLPQSSWFVVYLGFAVFYLLGWLALTWVGSRGQFMFLDNLVRNRGAVAVPWKQYARQGNVWFLFRLAVIAVTLVLAAIFGAGFFALNWSWVNNDRTPIGTEVGILAVFIIVAVVLWLIYAAIVYLIHSFVVPLYFKQTMSLGASFAAVARLVTTHPLSLFVYLLISVGLIFAVGIFTLAVFCVACCVIVWVALVPFLGTLLLTFALYQIVLPAMVFVRCFQLDCLTQFGAEYDVWNVDVNRPLPPG